jgi:hypothetical protein
MFSKNKKMSNLNFLLIGGVGFIWLNIVYFLINKESLFMMTMLSETTIYLVFLTIEIFIYLMLI